MLMITAMMLSIITSCKDAANETPSVSTQAVTTATPEVELTIAADQSSDYVLVYPASATEAEKKAYQDFRTDLRTKLSVHFEMTDDSQPAAEGAKEILLGQTNRSASVKAYASLGENQVGFFVLDEQIAILSNFEGGFALAADEFINRYVKEQKLSVPENLAVRIQGVPGYNLLEVSNTRDIGGDDPYVIEHDGSYYYCWSNNGVMVAKIDNLDNITKENGKLVFNRKVHGYENVWAPELHYIDGEWYIYVAMCKGTTDNAAHRMYCLKGTSQDPTDPFEMVGQVTDSTNKWAIDGTVFKYKNELYTVWSGWPGDSDGVQNLYIAHMSNPWTIDSARVMISTPSLAYERRATNPCAVNEGPAVLVRGDRIIVVYSANGSWSDDYLLTAVYCEGKNLMISRAWTKLESPLLEKATRAYGPGHCSFTTAEDGSLWVLYHANIRSGSGWQGRSVRIQPVEWKNDLPYLGAPKMKVQLPIRSLILGTEVK